MRKVNLARGTDATHKPLVLLALNFFLAFPSTSGAQQNCYFEASQARTEGYSAGIAAGQDQAREQCAIATQNISRQISSCLQRMNLRGDVIAAIRHNPSADAHKLIDAFSSEIFEPDNCTTFEGAASPKHIALSIEAAASFNERVLAAENLIHFGVIRSETGNAEVVFGTLADAEALAHRRGINVFDREIANRLEKTTNPWWFDPKAEPIRLNLVVNNEAIDLLRGIIYEIKASACAEQGAANAMYLVIEFKNVLHRDERIAIVDTLLPVRSLDILHVGVGAANCGTVVAAF